jgi:RNA polymerase sigma-70 factor (ECF subfamily)
VKREEPPLSALPIEGLLQRARQGEPAALEELFRRCQHQLEHWASPYASAPAGVRPSDISQEAAQRAFQRFASFRGTTEGEWFAWFKRIFLNQAAELLREAGREQHAAPTIPLDEEAELEVPASQHSPSQHTAQREEWRELLAHLSRLPESQREAIRLYYLKELRVAEVARELGKSEDAVASLLQRGLSTLRQRMAGAAGPEPEGASAVAAAFRAYLRRREAGEAVEPGSFAAEHPDCADELRGMLHWVERLQALRPSSPAP